MENPVFSKSDCIEHYQWGDDCHGWTFIDDNTISIKQELMPPNTSREAALPPKSNTILLYFNWPRHFFRRWKTGSFKSRTRNKN